MRSIRDASSTAVEHAAAVGRAGWWLIMKEQSSIEQPAALTEIPMLAEYEEELTAAARPGRAAA